MVTATSSGPPDGGGAAPPGPSLQLVRPPDLRASLDVAMGLFAPAVILLQGILAVRTLTIDDAYISFRYARNLVAGLGLVYNPGERVEGFSNLLWTLIHAGFMALGSDPVVVSKVLGVLSATGTFGLVYGLALRLNPGRRLPCVATWLLASSALFSAYAVVGLETSFYVFLLVLAMDRMMVELEQPSAFPWSAIPFALAALTRPETPLYVGLAMICLGWGLFSRQNLTRAAIVGGTLAALILWRHAYYGAWLPNSFQAKTGTPGRQFSLGKEYVLNYLIGGGILLWAGVYALATAALGRWVGRPDAVQAGAPANATWMLRASGCIALSTLVYPLVVGADWMPCFRYLAPAEPFMFLLVDRGLRSLAETRSRAAWVALVVLGLSTVKTRAQALDDDQKDLQAFEGRWHTQAGQTADWFLQHGKPGTIALGDIGWVGWLTDYPILDLLGLVDPVIANLPGGYGTKQGTAYQDYFFGRMPEYFVIHSKEHDCVHPWNPSTRAIYEDPKHRFTANYRMLQQIQLWDDASWCIYGRKNL